MYIQTAEIRNRIEPVLYDSKDRPLIIIPTTEDEEGNRFMHVHVAITNYLKRKALGKKIHPREVEKVYELIENFNRVGKWEPTKEDWTKSLEQLIADSEYDWGEYGEHQLSKVENLKQHVRKAIPDPPKPNYPARPMKVKRPLEPVEILPPVMPKEVLKKIREKSI